MKNTFLILLLTFFSLLNADPLQNDSYENMRVEEITVDVINAPPSDVNSSSNILTEIDLKAGDKFSQREFDKILKNLSKKYQIVEPVITRKDGNLIVHFNVTLRPTIVKFTVEGSKYSEKKILDKGSLKAPMEYNKQEFYQSITDIRDFMIKRGYFKADVSYKIEPIAGTSEAVAHIHINPGELSHVKNIEFINFSKKEKRAVYSMIKTSEFNILTNWLTGSGVLREEEVDRDKQIITHFIQNEGYIDAKVDIEIKKATDGKVTLLIALDRGALYHVANIEIKGNTLEENEALDKALTLKEGDVFSTEKVFSSQENIKSLYTAKGYLDTSVSYELIPNENNTYDIVYTVEESDRYKVGLIVVTGNKRTNNNVIYNNIHLVPGTVLDSSQMKAAQQRLQSTGFFKNVSVYAVKSDQLDGPGSQYRDVMIEVDENRTGAFHLSAGANSTSSVFGEISITENNFDINGLVNMWKDGSSTLRGAGQYLDIKGMVAAKEMSATVSWINPYINDSLWRLGVDIQGKKDSTISSDYDLYSVGGGISTIYPINQYFSGGVKWRLKDSIISLHDLDSNLKNDQNGTVTEEQIISAKVITKEQEQNSGIVSGGALVFGYNSTDNPFTPRKGIKSNFEAEFAGLVRNIDTIRDFPFLKFGYLNSLYYPLWAKGTLKARGDVKFIQPLWNGTANELPLTEKFFLGGVNTVRGFAPGQIGEYFTPGNPKGGISSQLLSLEYMQKIFQPIDAFVFIDSGSVLQDAFSTGKMYTSVGFGVRLHIGQPLPFILGWGYPINPDKINGEVIESQIQNVFFSMAGQF
jgi:outer membrane protein insertion porin family